MRYLVTQDLNILFITFWPVFLIIVEFLSFSYVFNCFRTSGHFSKHSCRKIIVRFESDIKLHFDRLSITNRILCTYNIVYSIIISHIYIYIYCKMMKSNIASYTFIFKKITKNLIANSMLGFINYIIKKI